MGRCTRRNEPRITFPQAVAMILATLFALWPEELADLVLGILGIQ